MGLIGTDIAVNFADRIFDCFSTSDLTKSTITLIEYLQYMDIYHNGDEKQRSFVTFALIDVDHDGVVSLSEFQNYLSLIISAIKKVHPGTLSNNLTEKEIESLFKKISGGKDEFNYSQFQNVYHNKPTLLSWMDYFKNNDTEILYSINVNIKELMVLLKRFFSNFSKILLEIKKKYV